MLSDDHFLKWICDNELSSFFTSEKWRTMHLKWIYGIWLVEFSYPLEFIFNFFLHRWSSNLEEKFRNEMKGKLMIIIKKIWESVKIRWLLACKIIQPFTCHALLPNFIILPLKLLGIKVLVLITKSDKSCLKINTKT